MSLSGGTVTAQSFVRAVQIESDSVPEDCRIARTGCNRINHFLFDFSNATSLSKIVVPV